jgi:hypothetical protein
VIPAAGRVPPMTPAALLDVWERAAAVNPLVRPLILLAGSEPGCDLDALAAEPLGRRDARLHALRSALAGSMVDATATCPECGEPVEVSFDGRDVWASECDPPTTVTVAVGDHHLTCRPPTTADLVAVSTSDDPQAELFDRSVVTAHVAGVAVPTSELADDVRAAVEEALGDADPLADLTFSLACPACPATWTASLDLAELVWQEVDHAARQTIAEIDVLARSYGWREPDVLALSPWRRQCYLGLVQG